MKEFISLYFNNNEELTNQQQYLRQFIKENNKAEYLNLLHEFFFNSNEEISKFAIKLFFSKLFLINEENIYFYSKNKDAMFFKFELNSSSPYFNCRLQQQQTPGNNEETSLNINNNRGMFFLKFVVFSEIVMLFVSFPEFLAKEQMFLQFFRNL